MRIAIIGSSGFIGRTLSVKAETLDHEVFCLDHDLPNGGKKIFCDLADSATLELPEDMEAVFYLAQSPYYRQFPDHAQNLFAINSIGPIMAAKAALESGCKFFCYASSGNVYKPSFSSLSEISSVAPSSPYAASKLMGETGLSCFKNAMRIVCCRIFGAYGPGQKAMLPWLLLSKIMDGLPVLLEPRGSIHDKGLRISFIYIDDLVTRLLYLMELAWAGNALPFYLNLAGPEPVSIEEFANLIAEKIGKEAKFEFGKTPRQYDLWADISLLDSLCPLPFTALERGVASMVETSPEDDK